MCRTAGTVWDMIIFMAEWLPQWGLRCSWGKQIPCRKEHLEITSRAYLILPVRNNRRWDSPFLWLFHSSSCSFKSHSFKSLVDLFVYSRKHPEVLTVCPSLYSLKFRNIGLTITLNKCLGLHFHLLWKRSVFNWDLLKHKH